MTYNYIYIYGLLAPHALRDPVCMYKERVMDGVCEHTASNNNNNNKFTYITLVPMEMLKSALQRLVVLLVDEDSLEH